MNRNENAAKSGDRDFKITINGKVLSLRDPLVDGRKLLTASGFTPADEHVLIQILTPGARSIGLDESVDLTGAGTEAFRAFATDRVFSFTVNGVGYEWGAATISEPELRLLAHVAADEVLFLEHEDEPDAALEATADVDLAARGVEHIHIGKRKVTVLYNHVRFELERLVYETSELVEIFGVPSGYVLDLIKPNGDFHELKPGERLKVRDGMEFVSHAPCGQSS
jgi:hypothetical protein